MIRASQKRFVHDVSQAFVRQGVSGRSSVSGRVVTVFGSTGFLGRYVVNQLAQGGNMLVIPHRGTDDDKRHLKVTGDLGQVNFLRFDLRNKGQIMQCIRHSDTVYNLIGRDYQTKNFGFDQVHVEGAAQIAKLCKEAGVSRLIHCSALNADANSPSAFLRSKALGEDAVRSEFPGAVVVRPGTMFGAEDKFYNRMYWFARLGFLPVSGNAKVYPVYVGDVAKVFSMLLEPTAGDKLVELVGPHKYEWAAIYKMFIQMSYRTNTRLLNLPAPIFKALGKMVELSQLDPIFGADESVRMRISDSSSSDSLKFGDFGINPQTLESSLLRYIKLYIPPEYQHLPVEKYVEKHLDRSE